MKRCFFSILAMLVLTTVSAQQIAVVSSSDSTAMCQTLADAINIANLFNAIR